MGRELPLVVIEITDNRSFRDSFAENPRLRINNTSYHATELFFFFITV